MNFPTIYSSKRLAIVLISAICCGCVVAAFCVWWFKPASKNVILSVKTVEDNFADDAGGAGTGPIPANDPLTPPRPSQSVEGHFSHSAVAVDSVPCAAIGR